jgi:hypothetical protein
MSRPITGNEKAKVITVTIPADILRRIDKTRGLMPRSLWLRQLAMNELKRLQGLPEGANPQASQAVVVPAPSTTISQEVSPT